jgi:hypothetical protein
MPKELTGLKVGDFVRIIGGATDSEWRGRVGWVTRGPSQRGSCKVRFLDPVRANDNPGEEPSTWYCLQHILEKVEPDDE